MFRDDSPINAKEARLLISQLQDQINSVVGDLSNLSGRVSLIPLIPQADENIPQAVNQIRNGSFSHSVNSWDDVVAANNGRYECAWWYSHPIQPNQPMFKNNQILGQATLTLGAVNTGTEEITITGHGLQTGTAFTLSGSIPTPLVAGTVYFTIRVDANTIKVASSYANAAAGTAINLTTTTTGGTLSYNYTLKDDSSTTYSAAFSDWDIPTGEARLNPDFDISCFLPGSNVEAGYPYYAVFSIAKATQYVYAQPSVRIFAGLYGYSTGDTEWDWLGGDFEVSGEVLGTVGTPTSREYRVYAQTNRGFSVLSSILTVASAPSNSDFATGARVFLSWPRVLNYGIVGYSIYRNTGGTFVLLQTVSSGLQQYIDNNGFQESAAGWPSADFDRLVSYTATGENVVGTLPYIGDPLSIGWVAIPFAIRVPQNYDKSDTDIDKGQWLRWGLTGSLDVRVTDGVTGGSFPVIDEISSAAAQFTAAMVGANVTVTGKDGELSTTILSFSSATLIQLTDPWPFGAGDTVTVVIEGAAPAHSLFIDLAHLTYLQGAGFSPNPEDISPERGNPAAVPNGTTQDGPPPGQPPGDGDGYPIDRCLYEFEIVETDIGDLPAIDLKHGMKLPDGKGGFNTINSVKKGIADVWYFETENGANLLCTETKRIFVDEDKAVRCTYLNHGDEIMTSLDGVLERSKIVVKHNALEKQVVVQIGLTPNHSFLAGSGKGRVLVSNRKFDEGIIPV